MKVQGANEITARGKKSLSRGNISNDRGRVVMQE